MSRCTFYQWVCLVIVSTVDIYFFQFFFLLIFISNDFVSFSIPVNDIKTKRDKFLQVTGLGHSYSYSFIWFFLSVHFSLWERREICFSVCNKKNGIFQFDYSLDKRGRFSFRNICQRFSLHFSFACPGCHVKVIYELRLACNFCYLGVFFIYTYYILWITNSRITLHLAQRNALLFSKSYKVNKRAFCDLSLFFEFNVMQLISTQLSSHSVGRSLQNSCSK